VNIARQTMAEYLALDAVSCTDVLNLRRSAAYSEYVRTHPRGDTDATRLGSLWHCLTLEPETEQDRFIVAETCAAETKARTPCVNQGALYLDGEWFCRVRGHAPLAAATPTLEVVTPAQIALARAMADSLRAHPQWEKLTDGAQLEVTSGFERNGIPCKARADVLTEDGIIILDLKSVARPERFQHQALDLAYDIRAAWYLNAFRAQCYVLAVVASGPPHEAALYMVDGWWLEQGESKLSDLWWLYQECRRTGVWSPGSDAIMSLPEPAWVGGGLDLAGLPVEEEEANEPA